MRGCPREAQGEKYFGNGSALLNGVMLATPVPIRITIIYGL